MILGVDPGKKGALVFLNESRVIQEVADMPSDPVALVELLRGYAPQIRFAVIEDVGAMTYTAIDAQGNRFKRGQGAAASFTFGFDAGTLCGALTALKVRIFYVKPSAWKITYGLTSNKDDSRALAIKKFPSHAQAFARKKDDGRAEAALLALFGAERFK